MAQQSKQGTPIFGLIFTSILITLLLLLTLNTNLVKQFTFIILLATLSSLIPYLFTMASELIIFVNRREEFNGKRLLGSSIIAVLAMLYAFWALMGSGEDTVFWGCLLFFTSAPVYAWVKWHGQKTVLQPT